MKATKKQIAEVTEIAILMNFDPKKALSTLSNCSKSIFDVIKSKGVVESAMRAYSEHFVDSTYVAYLANKKGVNVSSLLTPEQNFVNFGTL